MAEVIVETRKLTKIYRDFWGRQKKTALRALNIEILKGEIFGLLGPNGSGKTTTIKMLLGLLFPTEGEAFLFGQAAADVRKNERIGYLPEESYLYRFLNAEETLDFYGRLFNLDPNVRNKRAQDLIERVGLKNDRKRILREYSKGMRQRIGFAQALINDPEFVILDEPTSGLDPLGTRWMKDKIIDLRNQGKTVLMCSHRLEDVQDICDRIAILYDGELQEFRLRHEVVSSPLLVVGPCPRLEADAGRVQPAAQEHLVDHVAEWVDLPRGEVGGTLELPVLHRDLNRLGDGWRLVVMGPGDGGDLAEVVEIPAVHGDDIPRAVRGGRGDDEPHKTPGRRRCRITIADQIPRDDFGGVRLPEQRGRRSLALLSQGFPGIQTHDRIGL